MIQIGDVVVSLDVFQEKFLCDLGACKGACCEVGDSGAPLEPGEAKLIDQHYAAIEPYMTARGKKSVKDQGCTSVVDIDGELVTPIVQEYAECVYAKKDKKGGNEDDDGTHLHFMSFDLFAQILGCATDHQPGDKRRH